LGGLSGSQPIGFANTFYSPLGRSAGHGRRSRGRQPSFRRPSAREGFSWAREFDNLQPGDETRIRAVLAEQQKTVGSGLSMVDASRFPPICSDKPHIDDSRYLRLLSTPLGQAKSILAVTSAVGSHWTASIWWSCCRPSSPRPGILTRRCHADSCTTARGGGPWRPPGSVVHRR
jgi:hypothetical protein